MTIDALPRKRTVSAILYHSMPSPSYDDLYCSADFKDGKAEGRAYIVMRDRNSNPDIILNTLVDFENGLANGKIEGEFGMKLYGKNSREPEVHLYSDSGAYPYLEAKNGKLEGEARLRTYGKDGKDYGVSFKDGQIAPPDGMSQEVADRLNAALARIYPIECDLEKRFELDKLSSEEVRQLTRHDVTP
ncbi:MAG: hypothetical protein LBF93_06220 [Zoogloeaceae bacterium]|nr:hypothetical protein [Zoogloeaceae bacterium]